MRVTGKGNKTRLIPIERKASEAIENYPGFRRLSLLMPFQAFRSR